VANNKDLIARPILGAVGTLAAAGLTEGGMALLTRLLNKKNELDDKAKAILSNMGGGIMKF